MTDKRACKHDRGFWRQPWAKHPRSCLQTLLFLASSDAVLSTVAACCFKTCACAYRTSPDALATACVIWSRRAGLLWFLVVLLLLIVSIRCCSFIITLIVAILWLLGKNKTTNIKKKHIQSNLWFLCKNKTTNIKNKHITSNLRFLGFSADNNNS